MEACTGRSTRRCTFWALSNLYLAEFDEPRFKRHPTKSHYVLPNPTRWHFVIIALSTGEVVQDFSLDDEKLAECRIEDIDDDGILRQVQSSSRLLSASELTALLEGTGTGGEKLILRLW